MGIYKGYDVRGKYPDEITEAHAYKIGRAYATLFKVKTVVLGRDIRLSGESLSDALQKGLIDQGCTVINIGLCSTDLFYFSVDYLKADGGCMVTASHMTKEYNGIKVVGQHASAITYETGISQIEKCVAADVFKDPQKKGSVREAETLTAFVSLIKKSCDLSHIKGLKIVMDPGNGMAGLVAEPLFKDLKVDLIKINFTPDGNFPAHGPNPLLVENRKQMHSLVKKHKADLGVMWDADCDRVFFIDNNSAYVPADFIGALIMKQILKKNKGATVPKDLRSSSYIDQVVKEAGGKLDFAKVGHSYFKEKMRATNALYAAEFTGHHYFKLGNLYADNGFIPVLHILDLICTSGKTMSELIAEAGEHFKSDEINSIVKDKAGVLKKIEKYYEKSFKKMNHFDGLSMYFDGWWFNVRASNTDDLLRLNLEASSKKQLEQKTKEVLSLIQISPR